MLFFNGAPDNFANSPSSLYLSCKPCYVSPGGTAMENNPIIDLGKSLRDMLVVIGFPPEPTALLERVEVRMGDPDIADLVAVIHDQVRALKAVEARIEELFTQLT